MAEDFDDVAEFYNTWTEIAGDGGDLAFYRDLATEHAGLSADLGIGTGRVAAVATPTFGVDISESMLKLAKKAVTSDTQLFQADITSVRFPRLLDFQYCAQNTLNHIADGTQHAVFSQAWHNGKAGSFFVLDAALVATEYLRIRDRIPVMRARGDSAVVLDITRLLGDDGRQAEITGILERIGEDGTVLSRQYFRPIRFTFLTVDEVSRWATSAGWEIVAIYGGFDRSPLSNDARSAVWVLQKPAEPGNR